MPFSLAIRSSFVVDFWKEADFTLKRRFPSSPLLPSQKSGNPQIKQSGKLGMQLGQPHAICCFSSKPAEGISNRLCASLCPLCGETMMPLPQSGRREAQSNSYVLHQVDSTAYPVQTIPPSALHCTFSALWFWGFAEFPNDFQKSNIVGYQANPIGGIKLMTPTFEELGGEEYPIDKFTVQNATDAQTTINVLDDKGLVLGEYYWYNADESMGYPAGWFDPTGSEPAGITLKPGFGVLFNTSESGVTVQSAGQVSGAVTRDVAGYCIVGNCSPVEISIDDLFIAGATDAQTTINVLDDKGLVAGEYYWYNADESMGYPAGWFDPTGSEPAGITLKPGESVLLNTTESGVTATIPGALAK